MGEPVKGDIADGIRLVTSVIPLKTNITGSKGDFLIKDTTNDWYTNVVTTTVGEIANAITALGVFQAQEDFDTTGIADGVGTVAVFGASSQIYAPVAASVGPNQDVTLQVLVDDSPGPAIVGFGVVSVTKPIGKYVKMSGATVARESTPANGLAIIDLGAN